MIYDVMFWVIGWGTGWVILYTILMYLFKKRNSLHEWESEDRLITAMISCCSWMGIIFSIFVLIVYLLCILTEKTFYKIMLPLLKKVDSIMKTYEKKNRRYKL